MEYPEEKLAQRLAAKHQLDPAVEIFELARMYARLDIMQIPADVDGVCLNLKVPGERPRIILNRKQSEARMRFTLAHELGHVLIPWHVGTIVDETALSDGDGDDYWELEAQANRFASELLMPVAWVQGLIGEERDPTKIVRNVESLADVSRNAATIKLIGLLPAGYVFAQVDRDDHVVSTGRSYGTIGRPPERGDLVDADTLSAVSDGRWELASGATKYVWWHFAEEIGLPKVTDPRDWRELLDDIVTDMGVSQEDGKKLKQSINGVIAYANGSVEAAHRGATSVYAACLQRFETNAGLVQFYRHPDFVKFLVRKVESLFVR